MHRRPQFEPLARLAAAGCGLFGPWVLRGLYCPAGRGCSGPSSRVGALILPGAAAAALAAGALWGWLCRLGLSWVRAIDSRGCVCPAGCCCGGFAAGALLGWLCPYNSGGALYGTRRYVAAAWDIAGLFSSYTQSPPLRGGCRREPAGEGWCTNLSLRLRCHRAAYRRSAAWKGIYARSSRTWRCKKVYLC